MTPAPTKKRKKKEKEKKKKKTAHASRTCCPYLLQAQQVPALPYAKEVGRPGTGSYPAPSPDPTTSAGMVWYKFDR